MELIKLGMLSLVPLLVFDSVLDQKLINLRFKEEGDVDQIISQLVEESSRALDLESLEFIKV